VPPPSSSKPTNTPDLLSEPLPERPPADLKTFLRNVGGFAAVGAPTATEITDAVAEVTLIEEGSVEVNADPLNMGCFVDGIQAQRRVCYRANRPVLLTFAAAGALSTAGRPLDVLERLDLVCSTADETWTRDVAAGLPVTAIAATDPIEVERSVLDLVPAWREHLERELVNRIVSTTDHVIVCDGSVTGRPPSRQVVGVIKTHRTRYLPDPTILYQLEYGWRSPIFRIEASAGGPARWSCYVRANQHRRPGEHAWDFGLLRLEAFSADQLEPLAAATLGARQHEGAHDGRWDRHLAPVRAVEDFLRARRPPVF
jgi:hypothetical protein